MIDIRLARENPEFVLNELARRGVSREEIPLLLELDSEARAAAGRRDTLRANIKELSKRVGQARRDGQDASTLEAESRALGEQESEADTEAKELAEEVRNRLLNLPNLPSADAPDGAGPDDNVEVARWPHEARTYGAHQRIPHWDIGEELRILDMERGAKLSGSMFSCFKGMGAKLIRGLTAYALDSHADAFEEIRPPTFVRTETMVSTGHLPKFYDEAYHMERDDLWAIPTAEVPLTSMFRDEILDEADLPIRFTAYSPCFRREAGAAGRDTRGLLRVHEFDKVELFAYGTAEQSAELHADMLHRARTMLEELGLEYRVLDLCTGDIGISAARTFDLEVFSPGVDQWLEVSSVSWCSDYQARRANIRYRPAGGSPMLLNTLNGSALAWPRIWAALVETGRNPDGSVSLPDVLQPYLGTTTIEKP